MEIEKLKQYEKKKVRLILNNNYTYVIDIDKVTDNSVEGFDKKGETMFFAPEIISAVIPVSGTQSKFDKEVKK